MQYWAEGEGCSFPASQGGVTSIQGLEAVGIQGPKSQWSALWAAGLLQKELSSECQDDVGSAKSRGCPYCVAGS